MKRRIEGTGESRPFSFIDFYSRRVRRIFPSLIFCLLTFLVLGWFVLLPDEYSLFGKHTMGASAYVSNLLLWSEAGDYFQTASQTKPLLHLWSLGIEEQFYLIWPLVLFIAYKLNFNIFTLALVGALASFGFELSSVKGNPTAAFYSPFLRFWELMAGSLLAWLKLCKGEMFRGLADKAGPYLSAVLQRDSSRTDNIRLCGNVLSVIGLALILTAVFALDSKNFPGYKALLPVMGEVLMIAAGKDAFINRYLLSNRLMVWFGLISYPLYIWHWPFLSFAWIVGGEMPQLSVRIGCVVLAVIMSAVTYYFVEPRLRWGRYGGYKAAGLLSVMVIIGVTGYSVMNHDGYVDRVKMDVDEKEMAQRIALVMKPGQDRYRRTFPELYKDNPKAHNGLLEKDEGKNNIALFGDSHANALLPGLLINEGSDDGIAAFLGYCAIPLMGVQSGNNEIGARKFASHKLNYQAIGKGFEYVLSHREIKKVILTNFPGCFQFWGIRSLDNPSLSSPEQILSDGISRTFKALSDAGKEVVYVLDDPTFSKDGLDKSKVKACAAKLGSIHAPALPLRSALYLSKDKTSLDELCSMPEKDNGTAEGHAMLKKLVEKEAGKYRNIHVVDLTQVFCQDKTCSMVKNGKMLYGDSQHLNRTGAAVAAPFVFQAFGK
jgi:peptidoglycan/LPS O-acetylase OafA/YrhL